MKESPPPPPVEDVIAKEDALREPTPIITLPGYPDNFWDVTEPYLQSQSDREPTLTETPPRSAAPGEERPKPVPLAGPPMAESLRIRSVDESQPRLTWLTWLIAALAGIVLGAATWVLWVS